MFNGLWGELRRLVAGPELWRAVDKNDKAADELDALLREVLRK